MNWETPFLFQATAFYQLAALPFAVLFHYLCSSTNLSINSRYVFLLVGGVILACAAMGCYALLVFVSAFCSLAIIHSADLQQVHKRAFCFQMTWQTLCHLWLQYKEYYLQETTCPRFSITLSVLMLMTQRITSLTLDIHEGKVRLWLPDAEKGPLERHLLQALPVCTYLLSFPILLGGPLCSFNRFQTWIRCSRRTSFSQCFLWAAIQKALGALMLGLLKNILRGYIYSQADQNDCSCFGCIYVLWTSALFFRLTYYSNWMLDESLFLAAGLGLELDCAGTAKLMDADIWTLETTNMIAVFTRTWNKSTAQWLRRLIFQRSKTHPLWATFAFSAWWHGLHPGQVFGFLCWAVMVKADYCFHHFFHSIAKSQPQRVVYQSLTWCHTQLLVAYIITAVEMRSVSVLWWLFFSYNSFFPLVYIISLLLLARKKVTSPTDPHLHTS
nr:ghrelin O-acyltransferase [Anolis sagrei ordinatus]